MTMFGCPCCQTMLCDKDDAWWRENDGVAPGQLRPAEVSGSGAGASIGTDPFDSARGPDFADSVPGGTSSTATVTVGSHVEVTIDTLGDRDWYQVTLEAGRTYTIHTSAMTGSNPDPYLFLRDAAGTQISLDDDSGDGLNSLLSYTPTTTGTFFIDAGTYNNGSTGRYRLSVTAFPTDPTDVAGSAATTANLSLGGGVNGSLDALGDRDWYRIDLVAGQTYIFRTGATFAGNNVNTTLTVRNSAGTQLATNDDAGEGSFSAVRFTATASGTYYLDVGGSQAGQYNLTAFTTDPFTVYTNDQIANQLTNGYWGGSTRRWNVTPGGSITYNLVNLTAEGATLARAAYALWSDVTGINFTEVFSGGQITHDDNQSGAFASSSISGGFIISSNINVETAWLTTYGTALNTYSFQTYIHEIGHAIGLGHGGNYNGNADYGTDALYANDAWATTIMSYFDQQENAYFAEQGFTRQFAVSPMVADAVATTSLYGTANATRTGDTTYGFNNNSGRAIYDATQFPNVSYTIVDHGGTDTLDYSGFAVTQRIDLNQEAFSNVGLSSTSGVARVGNMVIARGTVIENAIGGSGNDTIIGNGVDNTINISFGGNDTVTAGGGNDVIVGGSAFTASDSIDGGAGNDQLGISGNYTGGNALTLGAVTLTNVEVLALLPGAGNSYALTMDNANVAAGVEMTIFAGNLAAGQNFTFNGSAETDGNFRTFGGLGTDTITGGALSDGFYFGPGKWQPGDSVTGGGGINDQLALDGDYTISIDASADVEVLVLLAGPAGTPNTFNITLTDIWAATGASKTVFGRNVTTSLTINGAAESGANLTYFGGRGSDTLTSGAGNDIIYGLEGNDAITGGAGTGDIAVYQGARATYSVVTGGGNVQIIDNDIIADGNDGTDTLVGIEFAQFSDTSISITSPIILDLDGGGVETLSAAQSTARYDMDGDGIRDDTSWFGKGEGLLFLDRDGNGTLSNAGEMSFAGDVANARSDLEGLAAFDSNGDGQLSKKDAQFASFKIWRDRDGDGVVDNGEVMSLKRAGVRSLSLSGTNVSATTALGDTAIVNTGSFTRTNGRQGTLADAVLTAFASSGATGQRAVAAGSMEVPDAPASLPGYVVGDDMFAGLSRTAGADARAVTIDAGLLNGSFDDALAQLSGTSSVQQPLPDLAEAEPLTTIATYGNWIDASLDRQVLLMTQDMAVFGSTPAVTESDRWRRNGAATVDLFAA